MKAHECQVAQQDAGDQLAQNRRLIDSLRQLSSGLGTHQDDHQPQENRRHRACMAAVLGVSLPVTRLC